VTFVPRAFQAEGGFTVARPIAEVFELFSPLGEKRWVPGWSPEILHPPGASWEPGMIFRTREESGDAVWVVSHLDRAGHRVEYHRLEPGHYVARIVVSCAERGPGTTDIHTSYEYVGLSDRGNAEIAGMTAAAYAEKMQRWRRWIEELFTRRGS
jgi:hypothetical protein